MKKILVLTALVIATLMIAPGVPAPTTSTDFDYVPQHIALEMSPDTVLPDAVPYCRSRSLGTIICYSPNFIRAAYNFPSTLDGTGQTIVIVDAFGSPTIQNDLAVFDRTFGIPDPPSFTIFCGNGGCPTFQPNNQLHDEVGWSIETSLDVQYAHAMAPNANIVLDVAATSSGNAINDAEAAAIALFPGSVFSQSFGIPEFFVHNNNAQTMQAHNNYLAAQAAKITVFASAGDSGATNGISTANALFPASDPLNTAVGGTEGFPYFATGTPFSCYGGPCTSGLATFSGSCVPGRRPGFPGCTPLGYGMEQVWNEANFDAATGGAPSILAGNGVPTYQSGLMIGTTPLSSRTTPDVTYNGAVNGGVLVYWTALGFPVWFIVGGTSAGSPQWAAIAALANQLNGAPLGFLNNAIYKLLHGPTYAKDFHDITIGNDQLVGTPVGFSAVPGWDAASGVGSPNVANLLPDLVAAVNSP